MPQSASQFLPKWVRKHPRISGIASIAGTLLMLGGIVIRTRGDFEDASWWIRWLSTDIGTGSIVILGFLLLICAVVVPTVLYGFGFLKPKTEVEVLDIQHQSAALSGIAMSLRKLPNERDLNHRALQWDSMTMGGKLLLRALAVGAFRSSKYIGLAEVIEMTRDEQYSYQGGANAAPYSLADISECSEVGLPL